MRINAQWPIPSGFNTDSVSSEMSYLYSQTLGIIGFGRRTIIKEEQGSPDFMPAQYRDDFMWLVDEFGFGGTRDLAARGVNP